MSLQFILGNSGSGKSRRLYENIIEASMRSPEKTFLVIVPEQFTMQTQRELVRLHPAKGLLNIDILSFQRLAHRIFEEVGADRRTVLEETGKTLLLRRAAAKEQDNLRILQGNLKKQGYLAQVKSLISEFTQYDIDSEKMEKLLEASEKKPQLYYKLQDIRLLYERFQDELQEKYITAEETLEALCQVADQSQILRGSVIALDGFTGFTPIQQKLLQRLLVLAGEVYVTVTIDAGEDFYRIRGEYELFYLSKKTIRSLSHMAAENGCEIKEPLVLGRRENPRYAHSPQMAYLERYLFRGGRKPEFAETQESAGQAAGNCAAQASMGQPAGKTEAQELTGQTTGNCEAQALMGQSAGKAKAQEWTGQAAGNCAAQASTDQPAGKVKAQELTGQAAGNCAVPASTGQATADEMTRTATDAGISLHISANPMEEAAFAARTIRALAEEGYRYQEIAVIVGDMAAYGSYLPKAFEEYEIPCFMDNTRSLLSNPFVEFIRAALDMVQLDYSCASVFRVLRTGLCGVERGVVDRLENYVLASGVRGFAAWRDGFVRRPQRMEEEAFAECEQIRGYLMEQFTPFTKAIRSKKTTVREKCAAFYELFCGFDMQGQLALYEKRFRQEKRLDLCKEYAQVYGIVLSLFDKMVELLGEEALSLKEYTEILEAGIEEEKVGIIPPAADRIQVGDLKRSRLNDIRVLLFLGLNDGWVPSSSGSGGLLSDMEREALKGAQVELAPTSREDSYIQKFYLYLNMTKPSKRLYLSCCKASMDGSAMRPSYVMRQISRLFGGLEVHDEEERRGVRERVTSLKSGLEVLTDGLHKIETAGRDASWLELYNWYRRKDGLRAQTEQLVEAAFLTFDGKGIGRAAARELYGEVLQNSVSRLEKFAACAFSHFLQYGLELREREEYIFQPVDLGRIVHEIVERVSAKITQSEEGWLHVTDEMRDRYVEEAVQEVTADYGQQILHSSARNEAMIGRIRRIMRRTIWALQRQIVSGHFYPAAFEVAFSQVEDLKAVNIALSEKEKMKLRGRIDRIDVCEKEKEVYIKVIDYKSGNTGFDLVALYHGLQLQLVVYMGAALEMEKRIHPEKEVVPAGIFYYHVKDPLLAGKEKETPEEINERILKELRPGGLVNEKPEIFREMDVNFTKNSSVIPVALNKDGSLAKTSKAASGEQFAQLGSFVHGKIREIGQRILEGEIAPVPYERKQQSGCDYCAYRSICGWDGKIPGTRTNRIREAKAEEIWELIGQKNSET